MKKNRETSNAKIPSLSKKDKNGEEESMPNRKYNIRWLFVITVNVSGNFILKKKQLLALMKTLKTGMYAIYEKHSKILRLKIKDRKKIKSHKYCSPTKKKLA